MNGMNLPTGMIDVYGKMYVNITITFGSGWWFFTNPSEKYAEVKLEIFPRVRGENKKYLKPPPSK